MTVTVKNIIQRKFAENSQITQYIAVNCKCVIDKFTATNTSGSPATLSVNLVAAGGSPTNSNLVIQTKSVQAGEAYTFPELVGQVLENGGFLSTICSASSALVLSATGREIT